MRYEVIVGNVGKVYESDHKGQANTRFNVYALKSDREEGRVAGEDVYLFEDGELIREHTGKYQQQQD